MQAAERMITTDDLMGFLKVSRPTLLKMIKLGEIPKPDFVKRGFKWKESVLQDYFKTKRPIIN